MSYVLDTNAVSALMRGDPVFLARLAATPRAAALVPEPVHAEIEYGIRRLPPSKRREPLAAQHRLIRTELATIAWTADVSVEFGEIKALLERRGARVEDLDVAIAAHARATDATLVTANGKRMARIPGLRIEDWAARS